MSNMGVYRILFYILGIHTRLGSVERGHIWWW